MGVCALRRRGGAPALTLPAAVRTLGTAWRRPAAPCHHFLDGTGTESLPSDQKSPGPNRPCDQDLLSVIKAFQNGEPGSFERLYRMLWPLIALRALRMGLGPHQAEDLAQEVLIRVHRYAPKGTFDRAGKVWAWVYTIAVHEVYKVWRKRHPDLVSQEALEVWAGEATGASADPPAAAASAEAIEDLDECLAALAEDERMYVLGVLVGGLTFRQAARAHGLTLGQFKHRHTKGLVSVRQCMRAKGHEVG